MTSTADRLVDAARDVLLQHPHLTPAAAYAEALRRDPALAREHHYGGSDQGQGRDPAPSRDLVDPAELIMDHAARGRMSFAQACAALPGLAAAWNRGEMVARPTARTRAAPGRGAGHDPYRSGQRVHFDQLSQAERHRHSPWLRRLAPGETPRPGATLVEKFGPAAAGGGSFVLEGA